MITQRNIRTLLRDELETALVNDMGEKKFRAQQIIRWVFAEAVDSWDEMTNISKGLREKLAQHFILNPLPKVQEYLSSDGTNKLAFSLDDKSIVESVLIPNGDRLSLCLSSQVGCKFNCRFCKTATMGFHRHLSAEEIILQIFVAQKIAKRENRRITNIVFMGMGEPFDNYDNLLRAVKILLAPDGFDFSKRKITISTVGHVPGIEAFASEGLGVNLAISLHAANDALRSEIMPANKVWPLDMLLDILRRYPLAARQRITFEYIIIKGLNHSPQDAKQLVKRLHGLPAKVNLIGFNPFDGCVFESPEPADILGFQEMLLAKGMSTSVRISRGGDKLAACGQLGQIGKALDDDDDD